MLSIAEKAGDAGRLEVARTLKNIADVHYRPGEYKEAESVWQRALAIYDEVPGRENPTFQMILSNLGALRTQQGRFADGELQMRRVMAIRERTAGADDPILER